MGNRRWRGLEHGHGTGGEGCRNGYVPAPSFEVQQVADLHRGWSRYRELVATRAYTKEGVWVSGN